MGYEPATRSRESPGSQTRALLERLLKPSPNLQTAPSHNIQDKGKDRVARRSGNEFVIPDVSCCDSRTALLLRGTGMTHTHKTRQRCTHRLEKFWHRSLSTAAATPTAAAANAMLSCTHMRSLNTECSKPAERLTAVAFNTVLSTVFQPWLTSVLGAQLALLGLKQ